MSEARQPLIPASPPFTLQSLRNAIPKHCFEPSALRSASYALRDLFFAGLLWTVVAPWIDGLVLPGLVSRVVIKGALWLAFAAVQGTILTGVWVVAHEAGHGSFSTSDTINNVAGMILHSFLLVPFFSWKFTHAAHHGATNHLRKDQVFVPPNREEAESMRGMLEVIEDAPLWNLLLAARMFLLGWPAYLLLNTSGQQSQAPASHFRPASPIFSKDQVRRVLSIAIF
jgi:fatty acid desaturase